MKYVMVFAFGLISLSAHAEMRQTIKCVQNDARYPHTFTINFAPDRELASWAGDVSLPNYELGDKDDLGMTTAKATFFWSNGRRNAETDDNEYTGTFKLDGFYSVNVPGNANEGYSYHFDNQAYRGTHGYDKNSMWDLMFYYPESVVGKNKTSFKGLMTVQPDYVDQGYYHIEMTCKSTIRRTAN